MNEQFYKKMRQAGKLRNEAILSLFPSTVQGHVKVIEHEAKEMVFDLAKDAVSRGMAEYSKRAANDASGEEKKASKISIE